MQPIVVHKYGGSSVADTDRIKAVAQRIADTRARGYGVVAVVSAMGHTTDDLYAEAQKISASPSRRELDMLLSCGERASMALLSMAVHELGYEAISFTGSQCGILTNDRHSGARILEVRPVRVQDELDRGRVVIVAGFQGVSYKREITTLGRGGSDTTAVALAAALGAEYCEICSDVDGVFDANPRLVSGAQLIDAISHDEMLELASHGAKILHAESVEFARRSQIALYARRTSAGAEGGTRVDAPVRIDPPPSSRLARGVTGASGLVMVTGADTAAVAAALAEAEIPVWQLWPGGTLLELDDVPDWPARQAQLEEAGITVEGGWGAVTAVGTGLGRSAAALKTVAEVAGDRARAMIASPLRITVLCGSANVDSLVADLHAALLEP
ncbi:MAG: aspartate kinase [Deltaproteobacteria bacterium]|nr:aspartate kinase [Deltaproteobacteria bacterium]